MTQQKARAEARAPYPQKENNELNSSTMSIPRWLRAYTDSLESGEPLATEVAVEARKRGLPTQKPGDPSALVRQLLEYGVPVPTVANVTGLDVDDIEELGAGISEAAKDVIELHAQGYTPLEIARETGHSRSLVYYHLDNRGLQPHRKNSPELTARQVTQIRKGFASGEPIVSLARRYQVTEAQVRYAVR